MMDLILSRIKNMIKSGINKGIDDSGKVRRAAYSWLGRKEQNAESFVPFGTFGCPTTDTRGIVLLLRSNESNAIVLDGDPENRIKKECKPGEFGVGNPITKSNIYFKENGDLQIEVPSGNINYTISKGVLLEASQVISLNGSKVGLNSDGLNPLEGVVTGECLDPVTGVPFPDKSLSVFARKS